MHPLQFAVLAFGGLAIWLLLGRVKPEDLSQEKYRSNLSSGKWSW